jgi:hypothetical protein
MVVVLVALESFMLFDPCLNWAVSINRENRGRGPLLLVGLDIFGCLHWSLVAANDGF